MRDLRPEYRPLVPTVEEGARRKNDGQKKVLFPSRDSPWAAPEKRHQIKGDEHANQEEDKVEALELGADDYVTKPFSTRELIARIRSAVRRVRAPARAEDAPIEIGELRLEPVKRVVTKRGLPVHLTRKEFDILHCLMSRAGRVVTYARLLTAVWGADCREEVEYLRTFVRQLRKKIEDDPANPVYLLTDVYVGYRFADAQSFAGDETEDAAEEISVEEKTS